MGRIGLLTLPCNAFAFVMFGVFHIVGNNFRNGLEICVIFGAISKIGAMVDIW